MTLDYDQLYQLANDKIVSTGTSPFTGLHYRYLYRALAMVAYNRIPGKLYITLDKHPDGVFDPKNYPKLGTDDSLDDSNVTENDSRLFILSSTTLPDAYKNHELADVEAYLSNTVKVYQDSAKHITIIVRDKEAAVPNPTRLSSTAIRLVPWLFQSPANRPTQDELSYLAHLSENKSVPNDLMQRLYQNLGFEQKLIDTAVNSMISGSLDNRKQTLKSQIEDLYVDIRNYRDCIQTKLAEIENKSNELTGLLGKNETSAAAEIKDYLRAQKGISVSATSNDELVLYITTTLTNFDPDAVDKYVLNHSEWYTNYDCKDDVKLLFRAIFVDRSYKVKIGAKYKLDSNCHVTALSGEIDVIRDECIPNPHINSYSCLGNYEPMLDDAEDDRNYISAIAICQQSASSMNLLETISTSYFFRSFYRAYGENVPVIINPQGKEITPKQAIAELKRSK